MDVLLKRMKELMNTPRPLPEDRQLKAIQRFWRTQEVSYFRDAYRLSWGLCLPLHPQGPCILEDRNRFQTVLDGLNNWTTQPRLYRRCYQGLVKSYFTYDPLLNSTPPAGRDNWQHLRNYLIYRSTLTGFMMTVSIPSGLMRPSTTRNCSAMNRARLM
jgi:hypothetical protein